MVVSEEVKNTLNRMFSKVSSSSTVVRTPRSENVRIGLGGGGGGVEESQNSQGVWCDGLYGWVQCSRVRVRVRVRISVRFRVRFRVRVRPRLDQMPRHDHLAWCTIV